MRERKEREKERKQREKRPPNYSLPHSYQSITLPQCVHAATVVNKEEYDAAEDGLDGEFADAVKTLWKDELIQETYARQAEFQLYDCAA